MHSFTANRTIFHCCGSSFPGAVFSDLHLKIKVLQYQELQKLSSKFVTFFHLFFILSQLQNTHVLSETVQMELAAYMVHWYRDLESWKSERFLLTTRTGSPLLAYMPRTFLYYLSRANQDKL
jgi:hypothetical protein